MTRANRLSMKMKGRFIIVFVILLSFLSCFSNRKSCKNADFSSSITIFGLPEGYVPLKNELHSFKGGMENSSAVKVKKAERVRKVNNVLFEDDGEKSLKLYYEERLSTKYNYRLVLDDSLYFDINRYKIRRDIYYTAVGPTAQCTVDTIHINGHPVVLTEYYNYIHLPFSLAEKVEE